MPYDVICFGCGERGTLAKLGSAVHSCGSRDVDLWFDEPEQHRRLAVLRGEGPTFTDFMKQAAHQPGMPAPVQAHDGRFPAEVGNDPIDGWNEYEGDMPSPNPMTAPERTETRSEKRAPTRPIPGEELTQESNAYVYNKRRPNDPPTTPKDAPYVAPHEYDLGQKVTTTPFLGRRKDSAPIELSASCPTCSAPGTQLLADAQEHAHWACQTKCGSLIDLDKHPEVDPYRPGSRAWGQDPFRVTGRRTAGKKDGTLLRRVAVIGRTNPGLSLSEILGFARQSVIKHPEA